MKIKIFITIACFLLLNSFTMSQDTSLYEGHFFVQGKDTMPYRVLLPIGYNPHESYPLILFLHGAGERGNDNVKHLSHGAYLFLKDSIRKKYPAIIVFPQCAENSFWANINFDYDTLTKKRSIGFQADGEPSTSMKLLMSLFTELQKIYLFDKSRLYVGGLSMGGMGTFELTRRMPNTFAAAIAICGGADTTTAKTISNTAWWVFHGSKDDVVDPAFSKNIAAALKAAGADVRLTLYPEDGHDSWDDAFKEPELFTWLFSHHK